MVNLDNEQEIARLDRENLLRNIQEFPEQVEHCWQDWQKIALPTNFIQAKSVLLCGMGGSGIGNGLATDLAKVSSSIPIYNFQDYGLPGFVNKDTLVIATSYSGNTEETIDVVKKAAEKTKKIITISAGGKLESLSTNFRTPHYRINYGSQPRAALGYSLTALLAIFNKLGILEISDEEFQEAILVFKGFQKKIDVNVSTASNLAKTFAQKLSGKIPVIFGSGILSEVARRWKGQFNENAKTASYAEILPELNHNSLVGLQFPKDLSKKIFVIILQSKFDHSRNRLRQKITGEILERAGIGYDFVLLEPSPTPLAEIFQTIIYGDYISYYLAILNKVEPSPVPIIQYLKDKLEEKPLD